MRIENSGKIVACPAYRLRKGKWKYELGHDVKAYLLVPSTAGGSLNTTGRFYSAITCHFARITDHISLAIRSGYAIDGATCWPDTPRNLGPAFVHDAWWQFFADKAEDIKAAGYDLKELFHSSNVQFCESCKENGAWLLGSWLALKVLDLSAWWQYRKLWKS